MLNDNRDILDNLAKELLEKETLDHNQLADIFAEVKRLDERPLWLSSTDRPLSDLPPIEVPGKAAIDADAAEGAVESTPKRRAPRPRKNPGIATA